jgi:hypothetical protein
MDDYDYVCHQKQSKSNLFRSHQLYLVAAGWYQILFQLYSRRGLLF